MCPLAAALPSTKINAKPTRKVLMGKGFAAGVQTPSGTRGYSAAVSARIAAISASVMSDHARYACATANAPPARTFGQ